MKEKRNGKQRITLADVAAEAGVSVQTASHVISGNMTVRLPDATRAKVMKAAEKVGYQPNRLAQAMKSGRTNMAAVWMPLDRPVVGYMRFLHEISLCARKDEKDLIIVGLDSSSALMNPERLPNSWPVDGILSVDAGKAVSKLRESDSATPIVVFGLEEVVNGDSVSWDVYQAVYDATESLIQQGMNRIVHVTPQWVIENYPREQRRRGYTEAMEAHGLKPEFLGLEGETSTHAELGTEVFLSKHSTPEAFTSFSDSIAIGTTRALLNHSICIPEQCQVWGYGDYPEAADFKVSISSLRNPIEKLVETGWKWLLERIADPSIAPRQMIYPMDVIHRESTKKN